MRAEDINTGLALGATKRTLANGETEYTSSFKIAITLDGLTSVQKVLVGEPLLGIDVYKRYDSVWNWENRNSALTMTKRAEEIDEAL